MKRYFLIFCAIAQFIIISCEKDTITDTTESNQTADSTVQEDPSDYIWDNSTVIPIVLDGSSINVTGSGATASGSTITITSAGNYSFSGTLTDGQILVNTEDNGTIRIILNSVNINSSTSAPIFIKKAKKVILVLSDNTENTVTDATTYVYSSADIDEPNAAIFSKANLSIFGNGILTVNGQYNDGITSKDGLIIKSGTINVNAKDDGIRGKDYLIVKDGTINAKASGDGLKSDNDEVTSNGYVSIENGLINITSGGDAISALTDVFISNGELTLTSGGGSGKTIASTLSAKGIKAGDSLVINGGIINISSADDAIHTNGIIEINGGTNSLASGDDGMHAEKSITINNGTVSISKSVEGIESPLITVNAGDVSISASDDGFNASKGGGGEANDGSYLYIKGGNIYVNASGGDGLDSNGSIEISAGTIIVHGPQSQPEVGMDYNGTCNISGGFLIISGTNSNMTQATSTTSTQYCAKIIMTSSVTANTLFHIQDADGNNIVTFKPLRSYYSIVVSSPALKNGATYSIFTGGSSTGTDTNGLYEDGVYTAGTAYSNFTISSIVTSLGSSSTGPGGTPGGRP